MTTQDTQRPHLFEVEKVQLVPANVQQSPDKVLKIGNREIVIRTEQEIPLSFGMYRKDTGAWLGTVGPQYVPVQNNAMYDVVLEAAELAGLGHEHVEFLALQGGRKVSFQVELPDWNLTGDDNVKRWVSALNSHDGSTSLGMGLVGTRIVCMNTWVQAHRSCSKFRHSASIHQNVKQMADEMLQSIGMDKELFEAFGRMQKQSYTDESHEKFIKELFGYDLKDLEKLDYNTTQRENNIYDMVKSIDIEMESAGRNMWGLFNGVTRYVNHERATRKADPNDYIYFGGGKELVDKALKVMDFQLT